MKKRILTLAAVLWLFGTLAFGIEPQVVTALSLLGVIR